MQKFITRGGKKEVSREWMAAEKQYQRELMKLPRLYHYAWGDKVGTFTEIATRVYQKFKEKWKVLNEQP